jgi:hypothetical protein
MLCTPGNPAVPIPGSGNETLIGPVNVLSGVWRRVRRCLGEHLSQAHFATVVPAVLRRVTLRPLRPSPERMVLRATTLVPHGSAVVIASDDRGAVAFRVCVAMVCLKGLGATVR